MRSLSRPIESVNVERCLGHDMKRVIDYRLASGQLSVKVLVQSALGFILWLLDEVSKGV
jgi:hypothetical protein